MHCKGGVVCTVKEAWRRVYRGGAFTVKGRGIYCKGGLACTVKEAWRIV